MVKGTPQGNNELHRPGNHSQWHLETNERVSLDMGINHYDPENLGYYDG